jgi:hypothetical protein
MNLPTLAICVALLSLAFAPAAAADPPTREVIPPGEDFITDICGYPILVESEGTTIRKTFTNKQGEVVRIIETYPGFRWILTNLDTGETFTAVIPGPAKIRFNADGTTTFQGTGPWGWIGAHPGTGETGFFLLRGRIIEHTDAAGNVTSTFRGRTVDICELLAT